jgi:hypothetical protein
MSWHTQVARLVLFVRNVNDDEKRFATLTLESRRQLEDGGLADLPRRQRDVLPLLQLRRGHLLRHMRKIINYEFFSPEIRLPRDSEERQSE